MARKTGPDCECKWNCFIRVSKDKRGVILSLIYGLADKDQQDANLFGLIQLSQIKKRGEGTPLRQPTPTR